MKKVVSLIIFLLFVCLCVTSYAGERQRIKNEPKPHTGNQNPITIYNNTGQDLYYIILGTLGGAVYPIRSGRTDIYHSGAGDEFMKVEIGACHNIQGNFFPTCDDNPLNESASCSNGHYNADLVRAIYINAPNFCSIICNDGSTTSCKQSG